MANLGPGMHIELSPEELKRLKAKKAKEAEEYKNAYPVAGDVVVRSMKDGKIIRIEHAKPGGDAPT